MSLWKRREPQNFGHFYQPSLVEGAGVISYGGSNPHSEQFDESGINKPKDLVNYLLAVQTKKFGKTILDKNFTYSMLQAHAKRLMGKYSSGELKRAVKIVVDIANHPFSFKPVEAECLRQKQKH